ncbi:hypothetical protein GCM10027578_04410 [Spirosoma luteolum]
MPLSSTSTRSYRTIRVSFFVLFALSCSFFALAQTNLTFKLLNGYFLSSDAPVNKGKPTLFVFEEAGRFHEMFKPATTTSKKPDVPNFSRDMVIGLTTPATNKPPILSISRIFVQDSVLTVRYIRLADTSRVTQSFTIQPMLLVSIPKQTVLKTRLVENGKVVQTIRRNDTE